MGSTSAMKGIRGDEGGGIGGGGQQGQSVIPAHLQTTDFVVYNSTPEMTKMFQMTLDGMAPSATSTAAVGQAWVDGVRVVMNPLDGVVGRDVPADIAAKIAEKPGIDFYDPATHAIYYNPYSGLQVEAGGKVIGIQSAMVGFYHEAIHAIDPMSISHLVGGKIEGYPNVGEWLTGQYEKMMSRELGEVERPDHGGTAVLVDNPTVHTAIVNGEVVWVKTNADGQVEIGHKYDFQKIEINWDAPGSSPKFGSQDPGHATDFNHPSPHDENGGTEIFRGPGDPGGPWHDGDDSGYGNYPDGKPDTGSGNSGHGSTGSGSDSGHGTTGSGSAGSSGDDGGNDFPFDWGDNSGGSNSGSGQSSGGNGGSGEVGDGSNNDPEPTNGGNHPGNTGYTEGGGGSDDNDTGQVGSGIDYGPAPDGSGPEGGRNRDAHQADSTPAPDLTGDWVPYNGQVEAGGGHKVTLEETSSDDPNASHTMTMQSSFLQQDAEAGSNSDHAAGSDWVAWDGKVTGIVGANPARDGSHHANDGDFLSSQATSQPIQIDRDSDAPTDLTGGTTWLAQFGQDLLHQGGGPLTGLPAPDPMPQPIDPIVWLDMLPQDSMPQQIDPIPQIDPMIGASDLYIAQLVGGVTPSYDGFGGF